MKRKGAAYGDRPQQLEGLPKYLRVKLEGLGKAGPPGQKE